MNAANPVILERALSRPPKEAEPQLRGDSVGSDRYTCGDYLKREYQKVWHPSGILAAWRTKCRSPAIT